MVSTIPATTDYQLFSRELAHPIPHSVPTEPLQPFHSQIFISQHQCTSMSSVVTVLSVMWFEPRQVWWVTAGVLSRTTITIPEGVLSLPGSIHSPYILAISRSSSTIVVVFIFFAGFEVACQLMHIPLYVVCRLVLLLSMHCIVSF